MGKIRSSREEPIRGAKGGRGRAQASHAPVRTLPALCESDAARRRGAQRPRRLDRTMSTTAGKWLMPSMSVLGWSRSVYVTLGVTFEAIFAPAATQEQKGSPS